MHPPSSLQHSCVHGRPAFRGRCPERCRLAAAWKGPAVGLPVPGFWQPRIWGISLLSSGSKRGDGISASGRWGKVRVCQFHQFLISNLWEFQRHWEGAPSGTDAGCGPGPRQVLGPYPVTGHVRCVAYLASAHTLATFPISTSLIFLKGQI